MELGERVAARVAARLADPVFMQRLADEQARADQVAAVIIAGVERRAHEVLGSDLERSWPTGRICEAWFVARFGASAAPGGAVHAFTLSVDRERQLWRTLRRYEAHVAHAPAGWPRTAWAAFAHAAATWQHRYPAGSIEGLDQLTVRMRGRATADDLERLAAARRRAQGRRLAADSGPITFRALPDAGGRWPAWVRLDDTGTPIITPAHKALAPAERRGVQSDGRTRFITAPGRVWVDAQLAVDEHHPMLPPADDEHRRLVERDAFLLAGLALPARLDGRSLMRDRHSGHAEPSGYDPRADRVDADVLELARLEGLKVTEILALSPGLRADMLKHARVRAARQAARERQQFLDQLGRQGPQSER